jgi:hypothetical protein
VVCPDLPIEPRRAVRRLGERWPSDDVPHAAIDGDGFLRSSF